MIILKILEMLSSFQKAKQIDLAEIKRTSDVVFIMMGLSDSSTKLVVGGNGKITSIRDLQQRV